MFKHNRQFFGKPELLQINHNSFNSKDLKVIEYRQPKVHLIGNLEKVQANYAGSQTDASRNFYYN
ncbi:hypothetical protein Xen7305DRAFT_00040780 [Xenococcus sp. PCC 7305]|uniref:hypothetical protein n=1 Tax=Xenococcus sp. PCC 7305 TaxID=102125 RepID=UPI0002ABE87C|nr:hypothetical protein [Xenococcus sp. PCC 7305]ELS04348.1 hypothetical protein Xen7305DRAFT_00040780 [Xenococcus sp. PCC 7305]